MTSILAGDGAGPLILALRSLFSQATLQVTLAGLTEAERNRETAFYDETLITSIRLSIPASEKTLPFPASSSSQTSFPLPVKTIIEDEEEGEEESGPPRLLSFLISCIQVSLDASYTAPRLGTSSLYAASSNTSQQETSTSGNYLIPATNYRDRAYQNIPLQRNNNNGEVTQVFHKYWSGNKMPIEVPDLDQLKTPTLGNSGWQELEQEGPKSGGEVYYVESKGVGKWVTEWRCKLPIIFARTRHPTPALLLTATMILRLQPSILNRISSTDMSESSSASESLYLHDLLNPLSEGPSYPDESPAERAARADASLAKLPLGKLPSSILGSKLVTPARNAKEVGSIVTKKSLNENGDMGDTRDFGLYNSRGRGGSGQRALTNDGLMAYKLDMEGELKEISQEEIRGLGEQVVLLQRSARRVLDVKSAIQVRMRTITVTNFEDDQRKGNDDMDDDDALSHSLILCVEVENPANSGMKYSMERVDVAVNNIPSATLSSSNLQNKNTYINVTMNRVGKRAEPVMIEQGTQINLLYKTMFDLPLYEHDNDEELKRCLSNSHRNVSIKLLGRPVLLQKDEKNELQSFTPTDLFISTWTCTLDLATQMKMVVFKGIMHNGAGSDRFRAPSISQLQDYKTESSTIHTLPPSPRSAPSRTTISNMLIPIQTSRGILLRRPSPRLGSGGATQNDSFVSLHRSDTDQNEVTSPALPSALVGQSILERARINRSPTTSRSEDKRHLTTSGNGSYDQDAKSRNVSEMTMTPTQRRFITTRPSYSNRAPKDTSELVERDVLLPLHDKRSTSTIHRLLFNPSSEEGLLIDICLGELIVEKDGQKSTTIHVQVENRSNRVKTLLLSWQIPTANNATSPWNSILIQDDNVQVGPLQRRDLEVTTFKLSFTKSGLHPLPPLAIYDTSSGIEKVLQDLQTIHVF